MPDTLTELAACTRAMMRSDDPEALYRAVDQAVARLVGHRLFTLLVVVEGGAEVERLYTSNPTAYPLTGRKPMGPTPWGEHVITGRQPWHGRTMADIRWAFPDHALIESLGCGSCINIPVMALGRLIGTMNVLDRENAYDDAAVETLTLFAPLLALPFAEAARAIDPTP
jgi:GAF domain-containing protein